MHIHNHTIESFPVVAPEVLSLEASLPPRLEGLDLPEGFGLKGGAARAVAAYTLYEEEWPVRDIDLVILPHGDDSLIPEMSKLYMPRDWKYGDGPERVSAIEELLTERDFTINEVAFSEGKAYFTPTARDALAKKRIELADEVPGIKMKSKAQLLAASLEAAEFKPTVSERLLPIYWDPFWCGLMFDRAIEQGEEVAERYTTRILAAAQLHPISVVQLAQLVLSQLKSNNVNFEHVTKYVLEKDPDYLIGNRYSAEFTLLGASAVSGWKYAQEF